MNEKMKLSDSCSASLGRHSGISESISLKGYFECICRDVYGVEKWRDVIHNLVTTVGKNDCLDKYLKGSAYTQTIRMGLKGAGAASSGDTQASHGTWLEVGLANAPTYSGSRLSVTMGAASGGASVSPAQVFTFTGSGTVAGCFINNGGSATIDNTTGILFSAGDFSGGNKIVASTDTLSVTYTLNA